MKILTTSRSSWKGLQGQLLHVRKLHCNIWAVHLRVGLDDPWVLFKSGHSVILMDSDLGIDQVAPPLWLTDIMVS